MTDELLVKRMKELRAQLADIDRRLKALDALFEGEVTDEIIHQYAQELLKIAEDKELIINEARTLVLLAEKQAPEVGEDYGAWVN